MLMLLMYAGAQAAASGLDTAAQTEGHATFVAGASSAELEAAVEALSADDLARLVAACGR